MVIKLDVDSHLSPMLLKWHKTYCLTGNDERRKIIVRGPIVSHGIVGVVPVVIFSFLLGVVAILDTG
jgi:hypothetical protein